MRITALPALAALALAVAACGGRDAAAAIPRARFVAANVALRTVPDTAGDAAALRQAALKQHRVTEKDLTRFVAAHRRDAEFMAEVWKEIAREVEKVHDARSRPAAGRPGAPPVATMPTPPVPAPGQPTRPTMMPTPPPGVPPSAGRPPVPATKPPRLIRPDTTRPPTQLPPPREPRDARPWQPVPGDSVRVIRPTPPPPAPPPEG
ncbi:MAG TPA: hypothetical protein VF746_26530 [Longimicrobium sp.]